MASFVLDCSVAMVWGLNDEANGYAEKVLNSFVEATAIVPPLWWLEICNILIVAQKRNRIQEQERMHFLHLLQKLPIQVDATAISSPDALILLCQEHQLTAYEGNYLMLSLAKGLPIASLDEKLRLAAKKSGCSIYLDNL